MTPDPNLLRACLAAPLDEAPRLILADWLEERGWGDGFLLAALRGEGEWWVNYDGQVAYQFSVLDALRVVYPETALGLWWPDDGAAEGDILFGVFDGLPACADCGRGTAIKYRQQFVRVGVGGPYRWKCDSACKANAGLPAIIRQSLEAAHRMGLAVPESAVRAALGLPEPVEG